MFGIRVGAQRLAKPVLATVLPAVLIIATFALLPGASAERTPVMDVTLPSPREGTSAVATDDGIFLFGGHDGTRLDEILHYDPVAGTLTILEAKLPSPRSATSAVWDGTHAYIFGGWTLDGFTDQIVRFDPAEGTVEVIPTTLPSPRVNTAAAWDGTHAWVIGGGTVCSPCATDEIVRFDPQDGSVTVMEATLPGPRAAPVAQAAAGEIVILGGVSPSPHTRHDDILHYDVAADTIRLSEATLPHGLSHKSTATIDGMVYVFGGLSCSGDPCDTIHAYHPESGTLQTQSVLLASPRQSTSAAALDSQAYIFGGAASGRTDEILRFTPDGTPPPTTEPPVLEPIADVTARIGDGIEVEVTATHPSGEPVTLSAPTKPAGAALIDHGDGTGVLQWTTAEGDEGDHEITVRASAGSAHATESFLVTVLVPGTPVIERIWDRTVETGSRVIVDVAASTDDDGPIVLTLEPSPAGSTFTDHTDGTGRFDWDVQSGQEGEWAFTLTATAGERSSEEPFAVTVKKALLPPEWEDVEPPVVVVGRYTQFSVQATHPEGEHIVLGADGLPEGASFQDHGDGAGTIHWTALDHQVGLHDVTLHAMTEQRSATTTVTLEVIRELDMTLQPADPAQNELTPGETRGFSVVVRNTGAQPLAVTFTGMFLQAAESGWKLDAPGGVLLDPGEQETVVLMVHAPADATYTIVRLVATGKSDGGDTVRKVTSWMADVPVKVRLELEQSSPGAVDTALEGVRGTVTLSFADGSPAAGIPIELVHRYDEAGPGAASMAAHTREGTSDGQGTYTFTLHLDAPAAVLPGDHTLLASALRGDRADTQTLHYRVGP